MKALLRLDEALERLVVNVGRATAWISIALIIVILFDVVTRRFFVIGSTKLQELEWHIHSVLFLLCLGYGYLKDAHVRIDLVRDRLSEKAKLWIELFGCVLFLIPYAIVVLYFGIDWWHRSFAMNEIAESATGLPYRWVIKAFLPIGFVLLLTSAVVIAFRKVIQLFGDPQLREIIDQREVKEAVHLDEADRLDLK